LKLIEFTLNGKKRRLEVEEEALLLNVIRDQLNLTGTKYVCGTGECGSCTVLLDDAPVLSCITLAVEANGRSVTTVEGLAEENLSAVQTKLLEQGGVQCGFCTAGFVMVTQALVKENPHPTEAEVREFLKGNLCRCTGYVNVVKGVLAATGQQG
jgi:carbon-monoxide dehydrogenase small subunit